MRRQRLLRRPVDPAGRRTIRQGVCGRTSGYLGALASHEFDVCVRGSLAASVEVRVRHDPAAHVPLGCFYANRIDTRSELRRIGFATAASGVDAPSDAIASCGRLIVLGVSATSAFTPWSTTSTGGWSAMNMEREASTIALDMATQSAFPTAH